MGVRTSIQLLERRQLFSSAVFPSQLFNVGASPNYAASADMNGDGNMDVIAVYPYAYALQVWSGNGEGVLTPTAHLPLGTAMEPRYVTSADVNLDGRLDLITAMPTVGYVGVLTANANGGFDPVRLLDAGADCCFVTARDIDGDSKLDLVVANGSPNQVSILKGNGDGTFAARQSFSTGAMTNPRWLVVDDFTGDGRPDIATSNSSMWNVSVLTNLGSATFGAPATLALGRRPVGIESGDLNRDGRPDLVVADVATSGSVATFLGNGGGTFAPVVHYNYPAGSTPEGGLVVRDFDGDGNVDVVTADSPSDISWYRGKGNGTLLTPIRYAGGKGAGAITAADFDNDGFLDLGITSLNASAMRITRGAGPSGFITGTKIAAIVSSSDIGSGDFNADHIGDVAVTDANTGRLQILYGSPGGALTLGPSYYIGTSAKSVLVSDLDADGVLDLVVSVYGADKLAVLRGLSNGTFAPAFSLTSHAQPSQVVEHDLNGDGLKDLVSVNRTDGTLSVFTRIARPPAPLAAEDYAPAQTYPAGQFPDALVCGDFTGDGISDVVVTQSVNALCKLLPGLPGGGFGPMRTINSGVNPNTVEKADLNHDGWMDLAVLSGSTVVIYLGKPTGIEHGAFGYNAINPRDLAFTDLNHDGNLDLVIAVPSPGGVAVGIGRGDGSFEGLPDGTFPILPIYSASGSPVTLTVADFTGDGRPDVATADVTYGLVSVVPNQLSYDATPPTVSSASFDALGGEPKVELTFDEPLSLVSIGTSDLEIVAIADGTVFAPTSVATSENGRMLTFGLGRSIPDGAYSVRLCAGSVCDLSGNYLMDEFRLEDATTYILRGDLDRDGAVTFSDLLILAQHYGERDRPFAAGNVDYDPEGRVDFDDLLALAQRYNAPPLGVQTAGNDVVKFGPSVLILQTAPAAEDPFLYERRRYRAGARAL